MRNNGEGGKEGRKEGSEGGGKMKDGMGYGGHGGKNHKAHVVIIT